MRLAFDCETNGLLPELTRLHSLGITDLDTGIYHDFADQPGYRPIWEGLRMLARADLIVGHNIIGFDLPAIRKVYPNWKTKAVVRDTMVLTLLMWPHIKDGDYARAKSGKLPGQLIGSHSLEAWGYRLGVFKDEYKGGWEEWNLDMHLYMGQDLVVTVALWKRIETEAQAWEVPLEDPNPPPRKDCIELEHRVAEIVFLVMQHGWAVNIERIIALAAKLTERKAEMTAQLQEVFPPREVCTPFLPKANNKKLGYVKGVPTVKRKMITFNPGSRKEIGVRLMAKGWEPESYGKDGVPTIDDDILQLLPYPEAKVLAEYFTVDKRLGQVANGNESWLKHERKGRIHGRIKSGGAHTGRMTHSKPNTSQTPANDAPYGEECRDCWVADDGYVLVGWDSDALELRDLAGYMAAWDGGAYIETVLRGDKALGTDMHSINAKLVGTDRATAKTWFYAMIYGSGDYNLGIVLGFTGKAATREGKRSRAAVMQGLPALGKLVEGVQAKFNKQGFFTGLDGRRLRPRKANAALNTLLQSAGAVQMKRALVTLYDALEAKGWEFGREYALCGLIHDEVQANVKPERADEYGQASVAAMRAAGDFYSFRCPLDAQYSTGKSWKETH